MSLKKRLPRPRIASHTACCESVAQCDSLWHETEQERARAIEEARRRAELLRWVRRQMGRRLTSVEQRCVEQYYFQGLTYRDAGACVGLNASSVCRAVRRAVNKLRAVAHEEGVTWENGGKQR